MRGFTQGEDPTRGVGWDSGDAKTEVTQATVSGVGVGGASVLIISRGKQNHMQIIPFLGGLEGGSIRCCCPTARRAQCR